MVLVPAAAPATEIQISQILAISRHFSSHLRDSREFPLNLEPFVMSWDERDSWEFPPLRHTDA